MKAVTRTQLNSLTGLRFFLALWVILYHQTGLGGPLTAVMPLLPHPAVALIRTGYVAVSLFFILSGFVLAYSHSLARPWDRVEMFRFWGARFARIYPLYLLGLLVMAPFRWMTISSDYSLVNLSKEGVIAVAQLTATQSWLPRAALTWNFPGWSISDEGFFYACFPVAGVALWRLQSTRSIVLGGLALWALVMLVPVAAVLTGDPAFATNAIERLPDSTWHKVVGLNPLLRLPEFCFGILLCRLYLRLRDEGSPWLGQGQRVYVPAVALTVAGLVLLASRIPHVLMHNGVFLPLFGLTIFGLALGGGTCERWLSHRWVVFLGSASFAMYILHIPIKYLFVPVAGQPSLTNPAAGAGWGLIYVLLVIAVSSVVFQKFEMPMQRVLRARLDLLWAARPVAEVSGRRAA